MLIKKARLISTFLFVINMVWQGVYAQATPFTQLFLSPKVYQQNSYKTVNQFYAPPNGFKRLTVLPNSFAAYLRSLPVVNSTTIKLFNGKTLKDSKAQYSGHIPINIKGKRLWQCMDILMVLYTDFLFKQERADSLSFPLPEGTMLRWQDWKMGLRPQFEGLHFVLKKSAKSNPVTTSSYLNTVFNYSGTQTFYHHYPSVAVKDMQPGDFIVKKGRKGHAVLILDMAQNEKGETVILVAQGDTPARQIAVLKGGDNFVWVKVDEEKTFPLLPISKKMYWKGLRRFPTYGL